MLVPSFYYKHETMKLNLLSISLAFTILFNGYEVISQDAKSLTGNVTTSERLPLNKVRIAAQKSGEVVYSDSTGYFIIKAFEKDVLTASASGFREKKVRAGNQLNIKIDLDFIDNAEEFNKAVAAGHIKEKVLQQAIAEKQAKYVKDYSKYNSIFELISCEVYEVNVKGTSVVNKKIRSFDSNPQVIFVVDNKIVSDISYLSPLYVKSIEFIDDVGATLYGSKGANGVIKITLK
jgi:hypothetical protein